MRPIGVESILLPCLHCFPLERGGWREREAGEDRESEREENEREREGGEGARERENSASLAPSTSC